MTRMRHDDLAQRVEDLLRETAKAHHQAFLDTDGYDPEWPLWYADFMLEKLNKLVGKALTRDEIASLLIKAEMDQAEVDPQAYWPKYYAGYFLANLP